MMKLQSLPGLYLSLSIPIDPENLNRQMQAAARILEQIEPNILMIPNYRLTFLVPAGGQVTIPFALPRGYVCTRRSPLRFESDYYNPNLTVDVYCDDRKVNPYAMPLTSPFEIDFGVYYVKFVRVDIVLTNNTTVDANVTFQVIPHIMKIKVFENWYLPIVRKSQEMLDMFAKS